MAGLLKLADKEKDGNIRSEYLEAVNNLVTADEELAEIIIGEAGIQANGSNDSDILTHLDSAHAEFEAGQAAMLDNPVDAITNFMQAWEQAWQVLLLI